MVPHKLKFYGIRDYEPVEMDLANIGEHVLIAGPNGSGKSTITFCMGAVLYSAKVDIEGLKSKNLPQDDTWYAAIHFLFKNEGPSQIDAPRYIEFSLHIEQEPDAPIKRLYKIATGDDIDTFDSETVFRSGGQQNFGDYRRELTDKYKIYPDDYYLIWYQQEVNQFAVMSPEERFRVFSDMHGISHIQKNWEESLEQVKDIEMSVKEAEAAVNIDKLNMFEAKKMYDRLIEHKKSINENGRNIILALSSLNEINRKKLDTLKGVNEGLLVSRDDANEALSQLDIRIKSVKQELDNVITEKLSAEEKLFEKENERTTEKIRMKELTQFIHELEDELKDLEAARKSLQLSEEETKALFISKQKDVEESSEKINELLQRRRKLSVENQDVLTKRAKVESDIQIFEREAEKNEQLLRQYVSKHVVSERISALDKHIHVTEKAIYKTKDELEVARHERMLLEKNHIVSPRQQEVLDQLSKREIKAYPFRSLVELNDDASLDVEEKLNTIKYTIFYDAKDCEPVNDLYHVSLRKIVPNRYMAQLPELQLRVKQNLTQEEEVFASKVLWWVNQFMFGEKPTIEGKRLIDERGVRGSQEKQTYILSERALNLRKKSLTDLISKKGKELEQLTVNLRKSIGERQHLHRIIDKVAEAEAFKLRYSELEYNKTKLANYNQRINDIQTDSDRINESVLALQDRRSRLKIELEKLERDLEIYRQLGAQTEQYEKLQRAKGHYSDSKKRVRKLNMEIEQVEETFYKKEKQEKKFKSELADLHQKVEDQKREKEFIEHQLKDNDEEQVVIKSELTNNEIYLQEIEQKVPDLFQKVIVEPLPDFTEAKLNDMYLRANTAFNITYNEPGINYEAEEIYKKVKDDYENKKAELERSKVLLEENKKRAEENKQNLITTIQMKVLRIHQLFQNYMSHFQFECEISFDTYEEKNGRIVFRLFIKVRKQGHRGKMEDVSLKARAGKVGKGVSGGEESLSSLLFALSLLQELDIRPSFIVLDEFDSALDDGRKGKVFDLYANQLERKLIIISPKGHENEYLNHFHKAYIAQHDPITVASKIRGIRNLGAVKKVKSS